MSPRCFLSLRLHSARATARLPDPAEHLTVSFSPIELVGALAAVLGLATVFPQLLRVLRDGHAEGVAVWTWLVWLVSDAGWVGYGVRTQALSPTVANLVAFTATAVLVWHLLRRRWPLPAVWGMLIVPPAALYAVVVWAPDWVGSVLLTALIVSRGPQIAASWRSFRAGAFTNVSWTTWALSFASSAGWIWYSTETGRWLAVLYAILSGAAGLLILTLEVAARRRHLRSEACR
jgi:uncharacterized protein with PQ loop repeat